MPGYAVLGSGYGTFESAFLIRSPGQGLRWDHAHNDWLQGVLEGGPLAGLAMLALAAGVFMARGQPPDADATTRLFRRGAVAACAAVMFHAFFDFPLRIPAIASLTACVAGMHWGQATGFFRTDVERRHRLVRAAEEGS